MSWQIILFFLAGPIIIGIGNLVLGPIFSKHIPFKVQMRSFLVGTMIFTFSYYWILLIVARKNLDYVV